LANFDDVKAHVIINLFVGQTWLLQTYLLIKKYIMGHLSKRKRQSVEALTKAKESKRRRCLLAIESENGGNINDGMGIMQRFWQSVTQTLNWGFSTKKVDTQLRWMPIRTIPSRPIVLAILLSVGRPSSGSYCRLIDVPPQPTILTGRSTRVIVSAPFRRPCQATCLANPITKPSLRRTLVASSRTSPVSCPCRSFEHSLGVVRRPTVALGELSYRISRKGCL